MNTPSPTICCRAPGAHQYGKLLLLIIMSVVMSACRKDREPPEIITCSIDHITATTAVCRGKISPNKGLEITEKGFCWASSNNPSTNDQKCIIDGKDLDFSATLDGFAPFTTYWLRAYATNLHGTAYGNVIKFTSLPLPGPTATDADGNIYHSVTIGTQIWTLENLKVRHFNNGDSIPFIINNNQWPLSTIARCCVYDNNFSYLDTYGLLYNWAAVNDARGIAPQGWHIPSKDEWQTLIDFIGGENCAGKLKEAGSSHWHTGNAGATNESGFTALPGGCRVWDGTFDGTIHYYSYFWTGSESTFGARYIRLDYNYTHILDSETGKEYGMSVRCVKNQ